MKNYKCYTGEIKDLDEKGIVTFYFSRFGNKDSDGDIIEKGAFEKTIKENMRRIKHFKNHNIYQLIGVAQEIKEDTEGAIARSKLILGTTLGKETYEEYKAGAITEHSFGYDVIKEKRDSERDANILLELRLKEFSSLTAWGANPETATLSVKSATDYLDYLLKMQKAELSDEKLKAIEKKLSEVLGHIKSLTESTPESRDHEPIDAVKYFYDNLKILQ